MKQPTPILDSNDSQRKLAINPKIENEKTLSPQPTVVPVDKHIAT